MALPSPSPAEGGGDDDDEAALPCCFCPSRRAPYTCPRCRLRFCSVPCYSGHGACARDFRERETRLRLQGLRGGGDDASRARLREALLRLRELREPGDVGLGAEEEEEEAQLWAELTPEEQAAFRKLLLSGGAGSIVPLWTPWWEEEAPPTALVAEGEEEAPPFCAASQSPLAAFQLPNALYGYAYALLLYNGVPEAALLPEACAALLGVSRALGRNTGNGFASVREALRDAWRAQEEAALPRCPSGRTGAARAVARLLGDRARLRAALAHLARLLRQGRGGLEPAGRSAASRAAKKCRFLRAWAEGNAALLPALAREAEQAADEEEQVAEVGQLRKQLQRMCTEEEEKGGGLIEELD